MTGKSIEEIKKEFETAGASVTQSESPEYKPREIRWKDNEEQERIEATIRDREAADHALTAARPKEVNPIEMLNDFIRGR